MKALVVMRVPPHFVFGEEEIRKWKSEQFSYLVLYESDREKVGIEVFWPPVNPTAP